MVFEAGIRDGLLCEIGFPNMPKRWAPKAIRIPVFLARIAASPYAVHMTTAMKGASNAWVRKELGWEPEYRSWRQGLGQEVD